MATRCTDKVILKDAIVELKGVDWFSLGIQLDIEVCELDKMKNKHPQSEDHCMIEVLNYWLKNTSECTWDKLADAVVKVGGQSKVVEKLRAKQKLNGDPAQPTTSDVPIFCKGESSPVRSSLPHDDEIPDDSNTSSSQSEDHALISSSPSTSSNALALSSAPTSPSYESASGWEVVAFNCLQGCGCGSCTLPDLCKRPCPKPNSENPLRIWNRGENEQSLCIQKEREEKLKQETHHIKFLFAHLAALTTTFFEETNIPPLKKVLEWLKYVEFVEPIVKKEAGVLGKEDKLHHVDQYPELFSILCNYWSWYNYDLLKHFIITFGNEKLKSELHGYEKQFEHYFMKRKQVKVLPPSQDNFPFGDDSRKESKILLVKVDETWDEIPLAWIRTVHYKIASILDVPMHTLYLSSISRGCIQMKFFFLHSDADQVIHLASSKKEALQKNGIIEVKYRNEYIFCTHSTDLNPQLDHRDDLESSSEGHYEGSSESEIKNEPTDDGSELQTLEATCPFNVLPSGVQESFEGQKMEGGSLVKNERAIEGPPGEIKQSEVSENDDKKTKPSRHASKSYESTFDIYINETTCTGEMVLFTPSKRTSSLLTHDEAETPEEMDTEEFLWINTYTSSRCASESDTYESVLEERIAACRTEIEQYVNISELYSHLVEEGLLNHEEKEYLESGAIDANLKVSRVLDSLKEKENGFSKFLACVKRETHHLGHIYIASLLEGRQFAPESELKLSALCKERIGSNRVKLAVEGLHLSDLMPYLQQESLLTDNEAERLEEMDTEEFLWILDTKGPLAHSQFASCLRAEREQRSHSELYEELFGDLDLPPGPVFTQNAECVCGSGHSRSNKRKNRNVDETTCTGEMVLLTPPKRAPSWLEMDGPFKGKNYSLLMKICYNYHTVNGQHDVLEREVRMIMNCDNLPLEFQALVRVELALSCIFQGKNGRALELIEGADGALSICEKIQSGNNAAFLIGRCMHSLSGLYRYAKQHDKAKEYAEDAMVALCDAAPGLESAIADYVKGCILLESSDITTRHPLDTRIIEQHFQRAIVHAQYCEIAKVTTLPQSHIRLAQLYLGSTQYHHGTTTNPENIKQARDSLNAVACNLKSILARSKSLYYMAESDCYRAGGDIPAAIDCAKLACSTAEGIQFNPGVNSAEFRLKSLLEMPTIVGGAGLEHGTTEGIQFTLGVSSAKSRLKSLPEIPTIVGGAGLEHGTTEGNVLSTGEDSDIGYSSSSDHKLLLTMEKLKSGHPASVTL